jgi:hypothetical protein
LVSSPLHLLHGGERVLSKASRLTAFILDSFPLPRNTGKGRRRAKCTRFSL